MLRVCVANDGEASAEDFAIAVNGRAVVDGLSIGPQKEGCTEFSYGYSSSGGKERDSIWIDSGRSIDERDEDNNVVGVPKPNPTGCDVICTPVPSSTPTPPPWATPRHTETPTPTPSVTPLVRDVLVEGAISEEPDSDGCSGRVRAARITFESADGEQWATRATWDGQYYIFLSPDEYQLTVAHPDYEPYEREGLIIEAGRRYWLDFRLVPLVRVPIDDPPDSGFQGTVYSWKGTPTAGVTLRFERELDGAVFETVSTEDGSYEVRVPRGRYEALASHPIEGFDPYAAANLRCAPGWQRKDFRLWRAPLPDPDNPVCGDENVDPGEDCDSRYRSCGGHCGKRYCIDFSCGDDCRCPTVEREGRACCGAVFHEPGCESTICSDCVCKLDPFCCDVEWDVVCASRAKQQCQAACGCPGSARPFQARLTGPPTCRS